MGGIEWARVAFGVELNGRKGERFVGDPFDRSVIETAPGDLPILGKGFFIDGVAVILRGEEALAALFVFAGLILPSMAKL